MARLEKEHSRREDLLRQEITHLQEVSIYKSIHYLVLFFKKLYL